MVIPRKIIRYVRAPVDMCFAVNVSLSCCRVLKLIPSHLHYVFMAGKICRQVSQYNTTYVFVCIYMHTYAGDGDNA